MKKKTVEYKVISKDGKMTCITTEDLDDIKNIFKRTKCKAGLSVGFTMMKLSHFIAPESIVYRKEKEVNEDSKKVFFYANVEPLLS